MIIDTSLGNCSVCLHFVGEPYKFRDWVKEKAWVAYFGNSLRSPFISCTGGMWIGQIEGIINLNDSLSCPKFTILGPEGSRSIVKASSVFKIDEPSQEQLEVYVNGYFKWIKNPQEEIDSVKKQREELIEKSRERIEKIGGVFSVRGHELTRTIFIYTKKIHNLIWYPNSGRKYNEEMIVLSRAVEQAEKLANG